MTREEAIQEIENNIKIFKLTDEVRVYGTKSCNTNCPYFLEDKYVSNFFICKLFNAELVNERLPQCLAIKPQYEYVIKDMDK